MAEIIRKILNQFPCRFRIAPHIEADSIQRIIKEMGIDLCLECPYFCFSKKIFFFFHLFIFVNGFYDMADTVQKFNSHFCKSVALAFCGNDVSDDFILPANRQCEYMGHVGK